MKTQTTLPLIGGLLLFCAGCAAPTSNSTASTQPRTEAKAAMPSLPATIVRDDTSSPGAQASGEVVTLEIINRGSRPMSVLCIYGEKSASGEIKSSSIEDVTREVNEARKRDFGAEPQANVKQELKPNEAAKLNVPKGKVTVAVGTYMDGRLMKGTSGQMAILAIEKPTTLTYAQRGTGWAIQERDIKGYLQMEFFRGK